MKILALNGSPKGEHSITLQYIIFLQKKYPEHEFEIFHIAQKIKKIEKNEEYFNEVIAEVKNADLIIWSFGLWVLAVSAQLMRFIELIKERGVMDAFAAKYAAAISTSIKFYDHTAHNYIRAIAEDLEMKFIDAASFYILDFMRENRRNDLDFFFHTLLRAVTEEKATQRKFPPILWSDFEYQPGIINASISTDRNILVLADSNGASSNAAKMLHQFTANFENSPEVVELNAIDMKGACLGCMKCGYEYQCQYKDGFRDFYNDKVMQADIIVFAAEMKGRFFSSEWKTFFDRAFFWNHTPSLKGKQIAYIVSGPLGQESNLQQMLEGHVSARQFANLVDIVTDECKDSGELDNILKGLAEKCVRYADQEYVRPDNFLGVGGHKIFRDEIYGHIRGVWQADHRYYRKHGLYNFPQKQIGLRIMNFFLLLACKIPSFRKKYYAGIMKFPAKRFGKEMDKILA